MALILNEDYYINQDGLYVFTEKYHLKRGYCCGNGCLHCPYGNSKKSTELSDKPDNQTIKEGTK